MLLSRRRILQLLLLTPLTRLASAKSGQSAGTFPITVSALQEGYKAEIGAYRRYVLFGRLAREDGYASIAYIGEGTISGADQDFAAMGKNAVLLLQAMMIRNERGIPQAPMTMHIEPTWNVGLTLS